MSSNQQGQPNGQQFPGAPPPYGQPPGGNMFALGNLGDTWLGNQPFMPLIGPYGNNMNNNMLPMNPNNMLPPGMDMPPPGMGPIQLQPFGNQNQNFGSGNMGVMGSIMGGMGPNFINAGTPMGSSNGMPPPLNPPLNGGSKEWGNKLPGGSKEWGNKLPGAKNTVEQKSHSQSTCQLINSNNY